MGDATDLDAIVARIRALPAAGVRLRVAVVGPPAAGKSTLAADLVARLGSGAVLVPMDGFHLDNRVLEARGLLPRKGAPESFDGAGFVHLVRRLGEETEVLAPSFDRARDIAIAGTTVIGPEHRVAVVEGNYLLLDERPWSALHPLWDLSVWAAPPEDVLRDRLVARWRAHGLDRDAALARAEANDLPNARRILANSIAADIVMADAAAGVSGAA